MTKLVEALESGEYTQATGSLRTESGFCCLGVACDISGIGAWSQQEDFYYYVDGDFLECSALPAIMIDYYGLEMMYEECTPQLPLKVGAYQRFDTASDMNDRGIPFAAIAQAIRESYLDEDADHA
jgi:hypothetical protein